MKAGCRLWGEDSTKWQVAEKLFSVRHKVSIMSAPHSSVPLGQLSRQTPQAKNFKPENSFLNKWKPESPYKLTFCTQQECRCRPQKVWANPERYFWLLPKQVEALATCSSRPLADTGNFMVLAHHRCLAAHHRRCKEQSYKAEVWPPSWKSHQPITGPSNCFSTKGQISKHKLCYKLVWGKVIPTSKGSQISEYTPDRMPQLGAMFCKPGLLHFKAVQLKKILA